MKPKTTGLATRLLKSYRIWRHAGKDPATARSIAEFGIVVMRGGKNNLFAQNRINRYRRGLEVNRARQDQPEPESPAPFLMVDTGESCPQFTFLPAPDAQLSLF